MQSIKNISIIGQGNVATHYFDIMKKKGFQVEMVSAREPFLISGFIPDLIIIAVRDEAIKEVSDKIGRVPCIIVHTSGTIETDFLKNNSNSYGSFYPLQTLKKGVAVDFSQIPLCTWANNEMAAKHLKTLALSLSRHHYELTDKQRKTLHIAAVFANNFTNHLFGIAKNILDKENIPFDIVFPLMEQTLKNAEQTNPFCVQTGPAQREDYAVMQEHLLNLSTEEQEIYKAISKNIIKHKQ
ncbi:MAG: DUF2520 domain-containing protein [Bacteroidales bacterium]|nr:DUF2520 domain-containing protein [Bacteroidales bacterium]